MKHKNLLRLLGVGLGIALLLSGCGESGSRISNALASPSPSAAQTDNDNESSAPPEEETPKDYSKYNAYLDLSDDMREANEILNAYFTHVEYTGDFALVEGGDYAALKDELRSYIPTTYFTKEALDYADEDPSYPAVDAAVRALGDSPVQVMEALDDLAGYMRFDDFEKDNMARAPELHAALWEPLQIFDQYYGPFMQALNDLADEMQDEDIQDLLDEGEMILYHSRIMIRSSQDILDNIWDQVEAANTDPEAEFVLPELDRTALAPLFGEFDSAYQELISAMGKDEEKAKVFTGPVADSAMQLYTNKVNALYIQMGALATALNEGGDYADAYDSVSDAVSSMIDGYNSII